MKKQWTLVEMVLNLVGCERCTWAGGTTPPARYKDRRFVLLRRAYFREYVKECGGLDLWKCAGTGSLERARIFWNRATLDAWATMRHKVQMLAQ